MVPCFSREVLQLFNGSQASRVFLKTDVLTVYPLKGIPKKKRLMLILLLDDEDDCWHFFFDEWWEIIDWWSTIDMDDEWSMNDGGQCSMLMLKRCFPAGTQEALFLFLHRVWGRFPMWLIFFRWVETTNQLRYVRNGKKSYTPVLFVQKKTHISTHLKDLPVCWWMMARWHRCGNQLMGSTNQGFEIGFCKITSVVAGDFSLFFRSFGFEGFFK